MNNAVDDYYLINNQKQMIDESKQIFAERLSSISRSSFGKYHHDIKSENISDSKTSIYERLYMNFTETCPLFLLKDGIDHRFEFLDFAPELNIRQQFHPISQNEFIANPTNLQTMNAHLFSNEIPQAIAEIE